MKTILSKRFIWWIANLHILLIELQYKAEMVVKGSGKSFGMSLLPFKKCYNSIIVSKNNETFMTSAGNWQG